VRPLLRVLCWLLPALIPLTTAAEPDWTPVAGSALEIAAGSPLDFSAWLPPAPAGAQGAVGIAGGRLVFAGAPQHPAKLSCVSMALSPATGGFPSHADADRYATQIRRHGYNLVRFHYVEATLMTGRNADFDFDPEQLDRFRYLLGALKRAGVYWLFDMLTSENGALGGAMAHRWQPRDNLKWRVHFDPAAQQHWRSLVDRLYLPVNPYTGASPLADPALAGVILVNEGGLNYLAVTRDRDADLGALLAPGAARPAPEQLQRLIGARERATAAWMSAHLRQRGYRGPITSYDNWDSGQADAVRAGLDWVDQHGYHDAALSFAPGTTLAQTSALERGGRYLQALALGRQAGKPYSVTEYGQPFWNRYRYEAGIMGPAMAALQGWDFLCLHAEGGIDLTLDQQAPRKRAIHPYGVGTDPVARAGETLGALLFMRGDVRPAPQRLRFEVAPEAALESRRRSAALDAAGGLAWITAVEQAPAGAGGALPSGTTRVAPDLGGAGAGWLRRALERGGAGGLDLGALWHGGGAERAELLAGRYHSSTGQLSLDSGGGRFEVRTARTEAVSSNRPLAGLALPVLRVTALDSPALVAASALDGANLADSRRILLILAGDAQNTGMRFADPERRQLVALGANPPQLRPTVARLQLLLRHAQPMRLRALQLDGSPGAPLPLQRAPGGEGGGWQLTLDTARTPTTFFLLEASDN
jgi:hypothetical protein